MPISQRLREMAGLTYSQWWNRRRRRTAIALRKCVNCFKARVSAFLLCLKCRLKHRSANKQDRERKRRLRVCLTCTERAERGYVTCGICLGLRTSQEALRRARGVCVKCTAPTTSRSLCARCWRKRKKRQRDVREAVLRRYGNACRCCGERNFLTIDHVFNDGHIERKTLGARSLLYKLLREEGLNPRYQLLCWNCNEAKRIYGRCPHKSQRQAPALRLRRAS
jgi:hypothetical protein